MALNLDHEFPYELVPNVAVAIISRETGAHAEVEAIIGTGADGSLFDVDIATYFGLDLAAADTVLFGGVVAGSAARGRSHAVEVQLLSQPSLSVIITVTFAENVAATCGNLLGLNFLSSVDFGLSHAARLGYLGRVAT